VKTQTGNHLARRAAAKAEPSPITALRDMLATAFAADLVAVTPSVCEVLRDMTSAESDPAKRDVLRNALVVLARQSGALPLAVIAELRARFDAKLAPDDDLLGRTSRFSALELTLVDESALKLELALDECSVRLKEQASVELFHLSARVCEMLGLESIPDSRNPVQPRVFARALSEALAKLGFDGEARLAVFKAYGPALLHIAPDLYSHANGLLAELGVLADFKALYGRPMKPVEAAARKSEADVGDEKSLAALLDRLLSGDRALAAAKVAQRAVAAR